MSTINKNSSSSTATTGTASNNFFLANFSSVVIVSDNACAHKTKEVSPSSTRPVVQALDRWGTAHSETNNMMMNSPPSQPRRWSAHGCSSRPLTMPRRYLDHDDDDNNDDAEEFANDVECASI